MSSDVTVIIPGDERERLEWYIEQWKEMDDTTDWEDEQLQLAIIGRAMVKHYPEIVNGPWSKHKEQVKELVDALKREQ